MCLTETHTHTHINAYEAFVVIGAEACLNMFCSHCFRLLIIAGGYIILSGDFHDMFGKTCVFLDSSERHDSICSKCSKLTVFVLMSKYKNAPL